MSPKETGTEKAVATNPNLKKHFLQADRKVCPPLRKEEGRKRPAGCLVHSACSLILAELIKQ